MTKNRGRFVAFRPDSVFMVAKNKKRPEEFILLDDENAHCRNGPGGILFTKGAIFTQGDSLVCVELLDAMLFLEKACQPDLAVGVGVGESFEKRGGTVPMEVNSADKGGNRVKGGRTGGRMGMKKRM